MHKALLLFIIIAIICIASFSIQTVLKINSSHFINFTEIEYIRYTLIKDQNDVIKHKQSEILIIHNNKTVNYYVIDQDNITEKESKIEDNKLQKLISLIENTGFLSLAYDYQQLNTSDSKFKNVLKVTLDNKKHKITWTTNYDMPPIINAVEIELNSIISQLIK